MKFSFIKRNARGQSAHNWQSVCQRSVVANRGPVGSAQISWLGIVVTPRGEGVVTIAGLQRFSFGLKTEQKLHENLQ
jgi:hypothetical protein